MDFIGDIVEKEVAPPKQDDLAPLVQSTKHLKINRKPSRWKARLEAKKINSMSSSASKNDYQKEFEELEGSKENGAELTEKEKVHLENLRYFASMSPGELAREKEELMESIDPKVLNALMKKATKGDKYLAGGSDGRKEDGEGEPAKEEASESRVSRSKPTKKVSFKEPVEHVELPKKPTSKPAASNKQYSGGDSQDDSPVPTNEKLLKADQVPSHDLFQSVHFPKNPKPEADDDYKIDIHDPKFLDKLHDKYFPDLPRDVDRLKWMEPVAPFTDTDTVLDPSELRFDFSGNIVTPDPDIIARIPISSGLYHHSDSPQLPGYTLKELADLCRSKLSAQRCIAIRTVGRILYKLGTHNYDIIADDVEDGDSEGAKASTAADPELKREFEDKLWRQVYQLQVYPVLLDASDENHTRNLSVRNYAIEALWLLKQGQGDKKLAEYREGQQ